MLGCSFAECYACEFEPLHILTPLESGGEAAQGEGGGVPLEHLISCVPGVQVYPPQGGPFPGSGGGSGRGVVGSSEGEGWRGVKRIQWAENRGCQSPPGEYCMDLF